MALPKNRTRFSGRMRMANAPDSRLRIAQQVQMWAVQHLFRLLAVQLAGVQPFHEILVTLRDEAAAHVIEACRG